MPTLKKRYKVEFVVTNQAKVLDKIADLMSGMDLGITGVDCSITEKVSWTTTVKVTKKYIKTMEEELRKAYDLVDRRVISINFVNFLEVE